MFVVKRDPGYLFKSFCCNFCLSAGIIIWFDVLGGGSFDQASGVACDSSDNIIVVGSTLSTSFSGFPTGLVSLRIIFIHDYRQMPAAMTLLL